MKNTRREKKKQTSIICHFPDSAAFSVSLLEDSLSSPSRALCWVRTPFGTIADVVSHSPSLNDAKCIFWLFSYQQMLFITCLGFSSHQELVWFFSPRTCSCLFTNIKQMQMQGFKFLFPKELEELKRSLFLNFIVQRTAWVTGSVCVYMCKQRMEGMQ